MTRPLVGPLTPAFNASGVWTGEELIIWGGTEVLLSSRSPSYDHGAAYSPANEEWRMIARGPLSPRSRHEAVWTGEEMLVWGGTHAGAGFLGDGFRPGFDDGAAYDPATDTWRTMASSPFGWVDNAANVWTGTEWVIAVTRRVDGSESGSLEFMAYNPTTNSWRVQPSLAGRVEGTTELAWTGSELFVRHLASGMFRRTEADDVWMPIADGIGEAKINSSLIWTGENLLAMTTRLRDGDFEYALVEWTPESGEWRNLSPPPGPILDHGLTWADGEIVLLEPGLVYDVVADSWSSIVVPDTFDRQGAVEVWLSDRLAVWGGGYGGTDALAEGALFIPEEPSPR